jgi:hypothetical protein
MVQRIDRYAVSRRTMARSFICVGRDFALGPPVQAALQGNLLVEGSTPSRPTNLSTDTSNTLSEEDRSDTLGAHLSSGYDHSTMLAHTLVVSGDMPRACQYGVNPNRWTNPGNRESARNPRISGNHRSFRSTLNCSFPAANGKPSTTLYTPSSNPSIARAAVKNARVQTPNSKGELVQRKTIRR